MVLKINYWNCSSGLINKFDAIKEMILEEDLDAFFIAESEIRSNYDFGCLSVEGYDLVCAKTLESRGKARLISWVKEHYKPFSIGSELNDLIALECGNAVIVALYRGFKCWEGETERSNLTRIFEALDQINYEKEVYCIGDFNIDRLKANARFSDDLNEWCDTRMIQCVSPGITRSRWVQNNLQESALDLLLTNSSRFKLEKEFSCFSDHYILKLEVRGFEKGFREKTKISWLNWKFDLSKARLYLEDLLRALPIMSNVIEFDYGIRASILKTFERFVAEKQFSVKNSNDVVSPKIIKLRNYRNKLKKKWLVEKSAINYVNLVRASRALKNEVLKVKKNVIKSKTQKSSKDFWKEINKLRGVQQKEIKNISVNGELISDGKKVANKFIDFFTGKVNGLLGGYTPSDPDQILNLDCQFDEFTEGEIKEAFRRLSNKKSSGMDNISGYFIKKFDQVLTPYIVLLFNNIIKENKIPSTWKIAKIIPVHKKGSFDDINNFRPVSNLNSLAKVFELCLLQRIEKLDQDSLHGVHQHGFRTSHSTVTAMAELVDNICDSRDQRNVVGVYSVDLTAAFDLLQKEKLVQIMIEKSLPGYIIRTIHSYLENRSGYVQIKEARSCVREIKAGCIQGSILGPLLFNIYTSNLCEIIKPCSVVSFADDSYVVASADNIEILKARMSLAFGDHIEWLEQIGMKCNRSKTELIVFGSPKIDIELAGERIESKDEIKVLGVLLDSGLRWESHVNKIISKCKSTTFSLKYLRKYLNTKEISKVVQSHIISRLTYASPIWSISLNYNQRAKIRSAFFLVLRIVTRDFHFELNRTKLIKQSGIENIDNIFSKRTSVFLYNIIYKLDPTELAGRTLIRSYLNDRHPGRMTFFNLSNSKIGKKSILNNLKSITEEWHFDWTSLTPYSFKQKLREQFQTVL